MANAVQVQPPEAFDFSVPSDWPRWRKRFERYLVVSGMEKKSEVNQIELLMYFLGDKADDVFRTLRFEEEAEKKKIDKVLKAFDNHFCVRKNTIYERAKFNSRIQEDGEPVDEFITALYKLAESCNFKDLHEELIRDRIVVGVRDKRLSERLQLDNDLTLEKAVNTVRQHEAVKLQQHDLQKPTPNQKIQQVKFKPKTPESSRSKPQFSSKKREEHKNSNSQKCGSCGHVHWEGKPCPAEKRVCGKCKKMGHYASLCTDKQKGSTAEVKAVTAEHVREAFLLEVASVENAEDDDHDAESRKRRWTADIMVNKKEIKFKLDSQADVTCLPLYIFKMLKNQKLVKGDINLRAAEFSTLQTVGKFEATLQNKKYTIKENIYVIQRLSEPLLSRRACELLNLVKRIEQIEIMVDPKKEYPELFEGIGDIGSPYEIKLMEGAIPHAVHTPRRVPIPLMKKLQDRLEMLEKMEIIKPVNEATEWCAPTVITAKPNGDIRLCVDLTRLNKNLARETHPMPVVEHMLGQLGKAKIFSKLDANSGFHQIRLKEESQPLTTFITPYGRYCFRRLPFGITSAPEFFQRTMSLILQNMEGVICYLDDILIFAESQLDHDRILRAVLQKLKKARVTLNEEKCIFGKTEVSFLGHIINGEGIRPDPKKIKAIVNMALPTNVTEVRRFMGLINHLGRFVDKLSEEAAPLNQLLRHDQEFYWGPPQKKSFERLKKILIDYPVLVAYDVSKKTIVSSDASSYGLGAVLKQETEEGIYRPVAYASRTMTDAEKRYAQIEKEALAMTWACERFQDFLVGKTFSIETDHKPLVPIFSTKEMDSLTPRLQRFRMRMMRFDFDIHHIPGKDLIAADALSRHPIQHEGDTENEVATAAHINAILSCIVSSDTRLLEIWSAQQEDIVLRKIMEYCQNGWPSRRELDVETVKFWSVRDELASQNGLLMRGLRIVIPTSMRREMIDKLHTGHLGISKCRLRARETMWWPGISVEIEEMIKKCSVCIKESTNRHEPLMSSDFPTRPWEKIGMDLFYFEKKWYLAIVDYYSRFPEVAQLERLTAEKVIQVCKSVFARHGIPDVVMSDNGTQFGDPIRNFHPGASREFAKFAEEYKFLHKTSSPKYPQSNGMAEIMVKILKMIFKKNADPTLALMEYRATPLENGFSPAELLMGRKLRTTLPIIPEALLPVSVARDQLKEKEGKRKVRAKKNYDERHGTRDLDELNPGDKVWIIDMKTWGVIKKKAETPRSYFVDTPSGTLRRNRFHLKRGYNVPLPTPDWSLTGLVDEDVAHDDAGQEEIDHPPRSRYGRHQRAPSRYRP